MPEIQEAYQNEPNFADVTWESDNIFIADCTYISFTVLCSVSCVMKIKWKMDSVTIFNVETKNVLSNTGTTIYSPVKSRYVVFEIDTFNSLPCDLKSQAFYFSCPVEENVIEEINENISTISTSLNTLNNTTTTINGTTLANMQTSLNTLNSSATTSNSSLSGLQTSLNTLNNTTTTINGTTLANMQTSLNSLNSSATTGNSSLSGLQTSLNTLNNTTTTINGTTLANMQTSLNSLNSSATTSNSSLSGLQTSLNTLNNTTTTINGTTLASMQTTLTTMQNLLNTLNSNTVNGTPLSAFGEAKVEYDLVHSSYIFSLGQTGPIQSFVTPYPTLKSYSALNTADVAFSNGCIVIQNTDTQLNTPAIVYGETVRYTAGIGCNVLFTARFQYNPTRRTINDGYARQLIGVGSKNATDGILDGFFFGYDSDGAVLNGVRKFGIHHYRNGSLKQRIYQENFNGDKADGSGTLPALNFSDYVNVFRIQYQYLGYGRITFFVELPTSGLFVLLHSINYANGNTETSLSDPTTGLLMLQETKTNARPQNGNDLDKLHCASFSLKHEGMAHEERYIYCSESGLKTASANVETHLITISNMTSFFGAVNRIPVELSGMSTACDGTKNTFIRVYRNRTVTGTAFSQPYTQTPVEISTTGTLGAGGILSLSAQMAKVDQLVRELDQKHIGLQSGDTVTITALSTANTDVSCSISWKNT